MSGRTCVVTGASGGIGSALVRRLVRDGARVVALDRETPDLPGIALGRAVDVRSAAEMKAVSTAVADQLGDVQLLVNNAGVVSGGRTWEIGDEDWQRVLATNLGGVVNGITSFVPAMVAHVQQAHVMSTASMAGVATMPGIAPYVVSKHGIVALSEVLLHDLRAADAHQVGVSVVCPGYVPPHLGLGDRTAPLPPVQPGMPNADDVADLMVDAVLSGRFYVFTHPDWRAPVERRCRALLDGTAPASLLDP